MKKDYKTSVNLLTPIFSASEELFSSLIVQFRSILQGVLEIAVIIQIWIPQLDLCWFLPQALLQ